MRRACCFIFALLLACVRNPVTGQNELSLIDEREEVALGRRVSQEFGELVGFYEDPTLTGYVSAIGLRLGRGSHRRALPWSFQVLDDPTANAFSMPGGQIFVTRGLLAHLNSEAELATVLGHEVGHVTARHGVRHMQDAAFAQAEAGLVGIFSSELGEAVSASNQLMLLRHGRADEDESDRLGFQYAIDQGYDGRALVDVLSTLAELGPKDEAGQVPAHLQTHPDTASRRDAILLRTNGQWARDWATLAVRHDEYLNRIAGLPFGDDPRTGYFDAKGFHRPDLKVRVHYPGDGWEVVSSRYSTVWSREKERALMELDVLEPIAPEVALRKFAQMGVQVGRAQPTNFGGFTGSLATFFVRTQRGAGFAGYIGFVPMGEVTVQLLALVSAERAGEYQDLFRRWMAGFGPITDKKVLAAQPARIEVVHVASEMTLEEFTKRHPSTVSMETVRVLNGLHPARPYFQKGQLAKRVVGTPYGVK